MLLADQEETTPVAIVTTTTPPTKSTCMLPLAFNGLNFHLAGNYSNLERTATSEGSNITFYCEGNNFVPMDGALEQICTENGTFSDQPPLCVNSELENITQSKKIICCIFLNRPCEGDTLWRWHHVKVTPCKGDTMWRWHLVKVTPCEGDSLWRWYHVKVTPCEGDTMWRWHHVKVTPCEGDVKVTPCEGDTMWRWHHVKVTPCEGDTMWRWHPVKVTHMLADSLCRPLQPVKVTLCTINTHLTAFF